MSRTLDVIRNRNKVEKELRKRKQEEIVKLRNTTSFRARASEYFKKVDKILADDRVESVVIEIDNRDLADFGGMLIESHELDAYEIKQVEGKTNRFRIRKRYISI
jgi:hypothetical protein